MSRNKYFVLLVVLFVCLSGFSPLTVLADDSPPPDAPLIDPYIAPLPERTGAPVREWTFTHTPNAAAAACTVPSDNYPTIAAAVADSACDPILISAGTYTENLVIERPVTINGAGADSTTVDGGGVSAVFAITNTAVVSLTGMTIQNGAGLLVFTENYPDGTRIGGGVANWRGTVTVKDSVVYSNTSIYGGGVGNDYDSVVRLLNTSVLSNTGAYGGGVYNTGSILIQESIVRYNRAHNPADEGSGKGGGVLNLGGYATIYKSTISHNVANSVGGIGNYRGSLHLTASEILSNTASAGSAGGMSSHRGVVFVENSAFSHNVAADDGGGIENEDGHMRIYGSVLSHNVAYGDENSAGGGLSNESVEITTTVEMTATAILSNSVIGGLGGGGIANHAALGTHAMIRLEDCLVQGNVATGSSYMLGFGGGIKNGGSLVDEPVGFDPAEGVVLLNNSTVRGNQAVNGGGIGNGALALELPEMMGTIINNSTLSDNRAAVSVGGVVTQTGNGGGVFNVNADLRLANSTVSGNHAEGQPVPATQSGLGGGIANVAAGLPGQVQLFNATIANNTAIGGGGVVNAYLVPVSGLSPAQMIFHNSIVAGNTDLLGATGCLNNPGAGGADAATITSEGYNLEDSVTCGFTQTTDLVNVDPLLGPLADNGGPSTGSGQATWTHALLTGSPAIDVIPVEACMMSTDQRGVSRPQGPACDIGAYEVSPPLNVAKTVAGIGGSTANLPLGGVVTYTIVIQNDGDLPISSVTLTDVLPSGVVFKTGIMTGSVILPAPDTLVWGPWDMAAREAYTISFTANVTDDVAYYGHTITNTVAYTSANAGGGIAKASFDIMEEPLPQLTIAKSVSYPADGTPLDGLVTYTIAIENNGTDVANSVTLTDVLPSGVIFGTGITGTASVEFPEPDTLTWGPWDVAAGESYTIRFTANVTDSQAFAGQTITNTVVYASDNAGSGESQAAFTVADAEEEQNHIYLLLVMRTFSGSALVTDPKLDFSPEVDGYSYPRGMHPIR